LTAAGSVGDAGDDEVNDPRLSFVDNEATVWKLNLRWRLGVSNAIGLCGALDGNAPADVFATG
jgi:hypothetical protein